jgi:hypothetical protein
LVCIMRTQKRNSSATSLGFTDYSQADTPALLHESVHVGAETSRNRGSGRKVARGLVRVWVPLVCMMRADSSPGPFWNSRPCADGFRVRV